MWRRGNRRWTRVVRKREPVTERCSRPCQALDDGARLGDRPGGRSLAIPETLESVCPWAAALAARVRSGCVPGLWSTRAPSSGRNPPGTARGGGRTVTSALVCRFKAEALDSQRRLGWPERRSRPAGAKTPTVTVRPPAPERSSAPCQATPGTDPLATGNRADWLAPPPAQLAASSPHRQSRTASASRRAAHRSMLVPSASAARAAAAWSLGGIRNVKLPEQGACGGAPERALASRSRSTVS